MTMDIDNVKTAIMDSEADAKATAKPVSAVERKCIIAIMPLLFRSVFGWRDVGKDEALQSATQFNVVGIDGSHLNCVQFLTNCIPPKGIVLLCHPFLKYGMAYFFKNQYQSWLNAAGYHVVGFNFKGFGNSKLGGIAFADDVKSVTQWIEVTHPHLPLHLLGASFGGYHGIHAIARHRLQLASVIFDSVPAHIARFFGHGVVGIVMRWLSRSRWGQPTGTVPLEQSYAALQKLPCLFLYGADDRFITPFELTEIRQHCPDATIKCYPECDHLDIRKKYSERYMNDITAFLDSYRQPSLSIQRSA